MGREIDRLHQEVNNYVEQMQHLRGAVNDLKEQKNKMCSDLQKKSSLLEQLEVITKENTQLTESVKVNIFTLCISYLGKSFGAFHFYKYLSLVYTSSKNCFKYNNLGSIVKMWIYLKKC